MHVMVEINKPLHSCQRCVLFVLIHGEWTEMPRPGLEVQLGSHNVLVTALRGGRAVLPRSVRRAGSNPHPLARSSHRIRVARRESGESVVKRNGNGVVIGVRKVDYAHRWSIGRTTLDSLVEQGLPAVSFGYRCLRIIQPEADRWLRKKFAPPPRKDECPKP